MAYSLYVKCLCFGYLCSKIEYIAIQKNHPMEHKPHRVMVEYRKGLLQL